MKFGSAGLRPAETPYQTAKSSKASKASTQGKALCRTSKLAQPCLAWLCHAKTSDAQGRRPWLLLSQGEALWHTNSSCCSSCISSRASAVVPCQRQGTTAFGLGFAKPSRCFQFGLKPKLKTIIAAGLKPRSTYLCYALGKAKSEQRIAYALLRRAYAMFA